MRTNFSQALKIFFSPETVLPFFLGSVFLAVLGNAVYDLLKNWLGTETPALPQNWFRCATDLFSIGICCCSSYFQAYCPTQARSPDRGQTQAKQISWTHSPRQPRRTLSSSDSLSLTAPAKCWLICSLQTLDIAKEIIQQFPLICEDEPIVINDIYDPIDFRDAVNEIYETKLPPTWIPSQLIADYAGMTAHGSVGMVLACIGTDRPLQ
ncbi:MAG: CRISPR-associated protein [Phormidesmis sp. CAN_BIN44]|nr:CRISPR-associated protein [Phormidesmis sp. CAN_BIN44]